MLIRYYIDKDYQTIGANLTAGRHLPDFENAEYLIVVENSEFKGILTKYMAQKSPSQPVERILSENPILHIQSDCKLSHALKIFEAENTQVAAIIEGNSFLGVANQNRIADELLHYQEFQEEIELQSATAIKSLEAQNNNLRKDLIHNSQKIELFLHNCLYDDIITPCDLTEKLESGLQKVERARNLLTEAIQTYKNGNLKVEALAGLRGYLNEAIDDLSKGY